MKAARAFKVTVPGFPASYWAATDRKTVTAALAGRLAELGYFDSFGDALPAITVRRSTGFDHLARHAARFQRSGVASFNPSDPLLWRAANATERESRQKM